MFNKAKNTHISKHLAVRSEIPLNIGATPGKWEQEKHAAVFVVLDSDFINFNKDDDDDSTLPAKSIQYDVVKGGDYRELIIDTPENFFASRNQALQIFHDKPELLEALLKEDLRFNIPYRNKQGKKFVAHIFNHGGGPYALTREYEKCDFDWPAKQNNVVILPE